jgi:hypothetical protein
VLRSTRCTCVVHPSPHSTMPASCLTAISFLSRICTCMIASSMERQVKKRELKYWSKIHRKTPESVRKMLAGSLKVDFQVPTSILNILTLRNKAFCCGCEVMRSKCSVSQKVVCCERRLARPKSCSASEPPNTRAHPRPRLPVLAPAFTATFISPCIVHRPRFHPSVLRASVQRALGPIHRSTTTQLPGNGRVSIARTSSFHRHYRRCANRLYRS